MSIKEEELVIRSAQIKDAPVLTEWWNDGAVMAHAGFPLGLGTNLAETQGLINEPKEGRRLFIIEWRGVSIGECSYTLKARTAEIGIKICEEEYQNRGIGRRALKHLIKDLFALTDPEGQPLIDKIVLDTNTKNLRAQHVYEALGFIKVRTNLDAWQDQLGEWQSSVDYELERKASGLNLQNIDIAES